MNTHGWYIEIVEYETNKVKRRLGPYISSRLARKIENGENYTLDHDRYFTRVVYPKVPA